MSFRSWKLILQIHKYIKTNKQTLFIKRKYGPVCLMMGITAKLSCDSRVKIQEPDVSKLSREYLMKSSSVTTAENALMLHTQVALSLQQAEREYKEALLALVFLLEFKLTVLGNPQEEARIWDLVLEGRSLVSKAKKKKDDLEILFSRTQSLLTTAAEVTFMTGADVVGNSAGDRIYKVEQVIREEREQSTDAEKRLQNTEVKVIHVEGKYAEDHAEELEEERQRLLQEFSREPEQTSETKHKEKENNSDGIEVIDIIGCSDETQSDNTAEEI